MASLPIPYGPEEAEGEAVSSEMDDTELLSILGAHEASAIGYSPGSQDEISAQQEQAIDYYYGVMDDLPAQEGSSSVTDRAVQSTIDAALAAILKPFVSSDEAVMFAPRGPEDVPIAEQATEYVNYVFNCDNPGFLITHDWFKDALLSKLGVVKVWWESEEKIEAQQVMLESEDHAAFMRLHRDYMGEEDGVAYIGQRVEDGRVKVMNIPPEEFRVSPFSRGGEIPIYSAHVPVNKTRSDLVQMGFDPAIVEGLPAANTIYTDNNLRQARYADEAFGDGVQATPHPSQERLELRDEYIKLDYNGDGVAELRRIVRVQDTLLLNEEIDEAEWPFATLCPIPMPHKLYGLSLADVLIEVQKVMTALTRQTLDNLYKSNNPRPVIGEGAERLDGSTQETLEDNAPGASVLVRDVNQLLFNAVPFTADKSFAMFEFLDKIGEERTGISKAGQGIDTNSLRKSGMTATEMAMISGGKNARVEMIARIFAETGYKQLFKTILYLVSKYQPRERMIRLRNQWVPIDPSSWPEMDVEISVGLGIGEKHEQIAVADGILETQAAIAQSPYAQMVSPENVFNAVRKKLNAGGVKNVEDFIGDPAQAEGQEPQPDPEQQKAQAELQLKQAELQQQQQLQAAKLQMQAEEAAQKQQLAREQAEFEAQLAVQKLEAETALAERKMQLEASLAKQKAEMDAETKRLSTNRPGGSLAE